MRKRMSAWQTCRDGAQKLGVGIGGGDECTRQTCRDEDYSDDSGDGVCDGDGDGQ